ncbi:hypothetical protein DEU56DRAFT_835877 [Suillus clintonianus]|uniref:uncharacterized protein n=1 Tax=Suillus clintonianus TaxID=1904413 RepID=UPI001B869F90|nr:uncharacterized protein DEU56DRAFT_835877 [Suillus clintonianus]KAG2120135.1 hypothetical protein DEU56DRAFT_835877 [Suillus clintonianus]
MTINSNKRITSVITIDIDIFAIAVLIRGLSLFIDKSFRQISMASCDSIVYIISAMLLIIG